MPRVARFILAVASIALAPSCSSSKAAPAPIECAQGKVASFPPSSGAPDTSCTQSGIHPKLACNQITLAGTMVDVLTGVPVPDGTFEVFDANDHSIIKSTANDDAAYTISFATDADGFRGRIAYGADGRWTHDGYFLSRPLVVGQLDFKPGLATTADLATLSALLNTKAIDPAKAIVDPWAVDCAGNGISNATIEIDAPYEARFYAGTGLPDPAFKTTSADNPAALFVNVQPGPINVTVRTTNPDGTPGAIIGRGRGVARASYWTAIFTSPE